MTYQSTNHFPQPTPNCRSSCENVTGSNVINVLKGSLWGLCPPEAKAFLLVIDNRRSRVDSSFCVITQHRLLLLKKYVDGLIDVFPL